MADPPVHERILTVAGHDYRQKYRYVYDTRTRRYVFQMLESTPVHPIYRRPAAVAPSPFETFPCTLVQLGLLATHLLNGTLTAEIALRLIGDQAVPIPPETLQALGVRVAFKKKSMTSDFEFLLWRSPPSPRPRPAPAARRPGRSSTGATRSTSSPSKGGSS